MFLLFTHCDLNLAVADCFDLCLISPATLLCFPPARLLPALCGLCARCWIGQTCGPWGRETLRLVWLEVPTCVYAAPPGRDLPPWSRPGAGFIMEAARSERFKIRRYLSERARRFKGTHRDPRRVWAGGSGGSGGWVTVWQKRSRQVAWVWTEPGQSLDWAE